MQPKHVAIVHMRHCNTLTIKQGLADLYEYAEYHQCRVMLVGDREFLPFDVKEAGRVVGAILIKD